VDRTIKLWKLPDEGGQIAEPLTLYGHTGAVYRVAFHLNGTQIASAGRNPLGRIYAVRIDDLVALAQSRLTRAFTTEECQKFLHVNVCPVNPGSG
jgi:WD40 repeat protein